MGKASWDASVTGLGPRDVPENEKRHRVGQEAGDRSWRMEKKKKRGGFIVQDTLYHLQSLSYCISSSQSFINWK